ncbi:hypothetical protein MLOOGBEN_06725 [Bacillus sp. EB106-08-02-XG196]|uniref:hypothetical protein n=1 Tax=Bacillus sp. EB106-08-02-XG196 TaxID=2737049 RepID=UPI0015C4C978|nr:hypothetical protein [Bacillus sp. EB106-08-02-XG196]NWQ40392.1 hypothetical protein [Bacillus sp. EB106-08-02-XG196]
MSDIEKMKKEIDEWRADRANRGLPPNPPDNFIPSEIGFLLVERCRHIYDFIVKYAKLCDDANEILPIDVTKFDSYNKDLDLINETIGGDVLSSYSIGINYGLDTIKNPGALSPREYVRRLLRAVELANLGLQQPLSSIVYDNNLNSMENQKHYARVYASYERYKSDEKLLNAELERLYAHYESIKHLY